MAVGADFVVVVAAKESPMMLKATRPAISLRCSNKGMTKTGRDHSICPQFDMRHGRRDGEAGNSCSSG
jgi:hypothetical protein